ncbi:SH3 domain-containing protein [Streptomyces flavidovirens]|uniref:SH3 domain-containing protein n=1 Tax=Streptomyces flavidovirens TaxID=67298 RepID=UPI00341CBDDF
MITAATLTITLASGAAVHATAAPQAAPAQPAQAAQAAARGFNACGYYPKTNIKLRTGPGARYTSIGVLSPPDWVRATKASGSWYKVITNNKTRSGLPEGKKGWVSKKHLKPATCMNLN